MYVNHHRGPRSQLMSFLLSSLISSSEPFLPAQTLQKISTELEMPQRLSSAHSSGSAPFCTVSYRRWSRSQIVQHDKHCRC